MKYHRPLVKAFYTFFCIAGVSQLSLAESVPPQLLAGQTARASLYEVRVELRDDADAADFSLKELKDFQYRTEILLGQISAELQRILLYHPKEPLVVRLLSPGQFVEKNGSAGWMGALYYNKQISLPMRAGLLRSTARLRRTLTHEFVHAASGELSGHQAPAWLEEGLAQLLEGPVNPVLAPALHMRMVQKGPFSLESLNAGFGSLPEADVPAAYAQSLFAVRSLVNRFGFANLRMYFAKLAAGEDGNVAFASAFPVSLKEFHDDVSIQLLKWSAAGEKRL